MNNKQNKSLKILACCHKEPNDLLLKMMREQTYLHPIFCGSIADKITYNEINGRKIYKDNTGDNLSNLNIHINEMTGIYWAWKHYDELDNPDYIGFCHYRRFFYTNVVKEYTNKDIISVYHDFPRFNMLSYVAYSMQRPYDTLNSIFNVFSDSVEEQKLFFNVFCRNVQNIMPFSNNMFIIKRDDFFELCEWLFPKVLNTFNNVVDKNDSYYMTDKHGSRTAGYVAELLVVYYFWKKYCYNKPNTNSVILSKKFMG